MCAAWVLLGVSAWLCTAVAAPELADRLGVSPGLSAAAQPADETDAEEHAEEEAEHESIWVTIARLVNFAVLAGGLFVMLRGPVATYLHDRGTQVREALELARVTNTEAEKQLAAIEEQLRALPGELDALRARGKEEVAAEEARLRESTEAARERMVEQSRREMEIQLRIARRDLTHRAAALATDVAARRIKDHMDDADQLRLVDRYIEQVGAE